MPYGDITVNTRTFNPRTLGTYALSTVAFGEPSNELRIRGATRSANKRLSATVNRYVQKDVTLAGTTKRENASVSINIQVPESGFTAAEIDAMASDLSEFLTTATITRLLQGES